MQGLLLDTTLLIDLSRGNEQVADFIELQRCQPSLSRLVLVAQKPTSCQREQTAKAHYFGMALYGF